jgi:hypothetical protein
MNVRDTSIESYKQVVNSGYLSSQLIKAFDIIFHYGPVTSREAHERFTRIYDGANNLNLFRSKLSMLQDMGVITTTGKVKCPVTHKTVYRFDVTGNLPVKPKRVTMADKKRDLLAAVETLDKASWPWFESEIDNLKQQINNL